MSKLPSITARECLRALQRGGFVVLRQSSSHIFIGDPNDRTRRTVLPHHNPVPPGTLRSIIRDLHLTVDEFVELLHK
ncbi:MAG: type II toxin-antitoxin system HicA family toxin [Anaerolineae bacterium]|nr:type II toxin-antitoxin system HicA family toxin [Anaerolineae bacterium]